MDEVYATLTEKMGEEACTSYEALQYLQSYVARKKKSIGKDNTGLAVFFGADLLAKRKAFNYVGELFEWFMGGSEFDLDTSLKRIEDMLKKLSAEDAEPVVNVIYGPLHQKVVKSMTKANQKGLSVQLLKLDAIFADVFQKTKKWPNAYKAILRLGDVKRAATVLNDWSKDAFKYEKPLFFARAVMTMLSEKKIEQAAEMCKHGAQFLKEEDNIEPARAGEEDSSHLAAWHLAYILSGLASLPPMQRVDKTKLFNVLTTLYSSTLDILDTKLLELLEKIGKACFSVKGQDDGRMQIPALFQGLMAANAPRPQGQPQRKQEPNMADIQMMLNKLQREKAAQK